VKEIRLNHGATAIVDDDDYERLKEYTYSINNNGYARRYSKELSIKRSKVSCILMHRDIMGIPPLGLFVDHINRNRLDNRKSNLRFVTRKQNNANRSKNKNKPSTSKYLGVSYDPSRKKWKAQISHYNKNRFIGRYSTEEEAAIAYNNAAKYYHGQYANLNIITED
jgi:hypothetical protein